MWHDRVMTLLKKCALLFSPPVATMLFFLCVGIFTRFLFLGSIPSGISWDEAAQGYVGAMVVQTGRDEHNQLLPRVFQSFGDYKAPLAMYLVGISTSLFGMEPWAVRLPYAIASLLFVFVIMRIAWLALQKQWLAFAAGWFALTLPWLFHFGRIGFESGLSLLFLSLVLLSWLEIREKKQTSFFWWGVFALSAASSLYVYHSAKVLLPGLLVLIVGHEWLYNREWIFRQWKQLTMIALTTAILSLPFMIALFSENGMARAAQTSIFHNEGGAPLWRILIRNLLVHFDTRFLIGGETDSLRHGTGFAGVFLISHFAFFCLGVALVIGRFVEQFLSGKKQKTWQKAKKWFATKFLADHGHTVSPLFWIALFVIGLLPAAIGFEVPHANRALFATLPAIMLMTIAIAELRKDIAAQTFALIIGSLLLFQLLEFSSFYRSYFSLYSQASSQDWMAGYSDAARAAWQAQEKGEKVKFTTQYGQPEIFFAWANRLPFEQYRWSRVPQITFGPVNDLDEGNFTYVVAGSAEKLSHREPTETLPAGSTKPNFYLYELR